MKRALAVKKVVALQLKVGSSSSPIAKMNQKRKNQGDEKHLLKKILGQGVASQNTRKRKLQVQEFETCQV